MSLSSLELECSNYAVITDKFVPMVENFASPGDRHKTDDVFPRLLAGLRCNEERVKAWSGDFE